jgi:thiamine biosynthesis protein ThiS
MGQISGAIPVMINGEQHQVPAGVNVTRLLAHLGIAATRVAIERNLDLLPRAQWDATAVAPGDRYEIVHLVGGG